MQSLKPRCTTFLVVELHYYYLLANHEQCQILLKGKAQWLRMGQLYFVKKVLSCAIIN